MKRKIFTIILAICLSISILGNIGQRKTIDKLDNKIKKISEENTNLKSKDKALIARMSKLSKERNKLSETVNEYKQSEERDLEIENEEKEEAIEYMTDDSPMTEYDGISIYNDVYVIDAGLVYDSYDSFFIKNDLSLEVKDQWAKGSSPDLNDKYEILYMCKDKSDVLCIIRTGKGNNFYIMNIKGLSTNSKTKREDSSKQIQYKRSNCPMCGQYTFVETSSIEGYYGSCTECGYDTNEDE